MDNPNPEKPHILFLFSDTGGGHRSAAEAVIEALHLKFGDRLTTEMVDFFREYAPKPFNRAPELYPTMVRVPQAWGLGYHLIDGHVRGRLLTGTAWPYVRSRVRKLVHDHPADLIVSVHPAANAPILRQIWKQPARPPFITVVTDLVSGAALWYHRRADLCIVPTEAARRRALKCGMRQDQVRLIGLPVADRFCQPPGDRQEIRQRLGWPQDRPVVVLVGGGEGMGPLKKTAITIASTGLHIALAIIAGRNHDLKASLEERSWPIPTFIYGFVREMPDFMQAADVLVTKAGPGTISEAINSGLPMILYSRVPGQEDGNVDYVVSEGAGIWAPSPSRIAAALTGWIERPEERSQATAACRRLARPQAARQIASILTEEYLHLRVS
jgi:1,2-diacylglycerol 3-beta-galactosyltransferase